MGFIADIFGSSAADAASSAANAQSASAGNAINFIGQSAERSRGDLQPFAQLGRQNIDSLHNLTTNPNTQRAFIEQNPFFDALADDAQDRIFGNQAARGKVGSGETAKALQNSLVLLGNDLLSQNIQQRQNLVNTGQNAATNQAVISQAAGRSISDLLTQQGNATASGIVGSANARSDGAGNLLGTGLSLLNNAGTIKDGVSTISDFFTGATDSGSGGLPTLPPGSGTAASQALGGLGSLGGIGGGLLSSGALTGTAGGLAGGAGAAGAAAGLSGGITSAGLGGISASGGALGASVAPVGAAAGSAPALGAGLGAGLATAAAALAPIAIAAFGASQIAKGNAKDEAAIAPALTELSNNIANGVQTTINGVTGVPFTNFGNSLLFLGEPSSFESGNRRAVASVYNPATREFGQASPSGSGFLSENTIAQATRPDHVPQAEGVTTFVDENGNTRTKATEALTPAESVQAGVQPSGPQPIPENANVAILRASGIPDHVIRQMLNLD